MQATAMQAGIKPFLGLTAVDLMSAPVMTIPEDTSLREAARLLRQSDISGAPVVSADGRCLGVLSSRDFVTWAEAGGETTRFIAPWGEMVDVEGSPDDEIRHYMTAQPVTVGLTTPIGELAQMMIDAHIHRVLVVMQENRPCGVVSSTDILAAVAQEARRASQEAAKPRKRGGRAWQGS
jgi:CBS-domain-containing membrane protein